MSEKSSFNLTLIFVLVLLLTSIGQVMSDMYLPSLPFIAHDFGSKIKFVQLTVSLYMYGYAFSQLFYGPLSDAVGRRPPLFIGMSICVVGSIVCLFAPSVHVLILGRFLQGLGAGAGVSVSRSIFRDIASGSKLARYGSLLGVVNVFIVATAPLVGSYIEVYFNWRVSFIVLAGYAIVLFVVMLIWLPETNQHIDRTRLKLKVMFVDLGELLKSPVFMGFSFTNSLTYGAILAWVTASPILLQTVLGLTPIQYALVAAFIGIAFVIGGLINAFTLKYFSVTRMISIGFSVMLISGLCMVFLKLIGYLNLTVIMAPTFFFIGGASLIFANTYAAAFSPFPKAAGSAAAIFGFMQVLGGAVASTIIAYIHDTNQLPVGIIFSICAGVSLVITRLLANSVVTEE